MERSCNSVWMGAPAWFTEFADPNLFSLILQITEFDDQVWLDGVPCPSRTLITAPPKIISPLFAPVPTSGYVSWCDTQGRCFSTTAPTTGAIPAPFKTEKHMIMLSMRAASTFRAIADDVFGKGIECSLDGGIEEAMYRHVAQAWETNDGIVALPARPTEASSEQIVFRALRYVQSRGDRNVEIATSRV